MNPIVKTVSRTAAMAAIAFAIVGTSLACQTTPATREGDKLALSGAMTQMNEAVGTLKQSGGDASKQAENIKAATALHAGAMEADKALPDKVWKMHEGAQRDAAAAEFHTMIKELIDLTSQIESSAKANTTAQTKMLLGQLLELQGKGHGKFIEKSGSMGG